MGAVVVDQLWEIVEQARHLADLTEDLVLSIIYSEMAVDVGAVVRHADAVQSQLDGAVREMEEYLGQGVTP